MTKQLLFLLCLVTSATTARAEIVFSSRATFDAAFPGLQTEDFEEMNVPNGAGATFSGPLDASTNNGIFSTGDILNGLAIEADIQPIAAFGASAISGTSRMVGASQITPNASTRIRLLNGSANTIGFDIVAVPLRNQVPVAGRLRVGISSSSGGSSTRIINLLGGSPTFFGIQADGVIDSVLLTYLDSPAQAEFVDNISFGATAVPEPSSLLLLAASSAGLMYCRRRRITASA